MCGRYSLFAPTDELEAEFGVSFEGFEPTYNAAPGQELPVVPSADADATVDCSWGLLPGWADDPDDHPRPINARAETVAEKATFREAYRERRCLVPADGFYEWTDDGPYRVAFEDDRPFAMAGIRSVWEGRPAQASLAQFGDGDDDGYRRVESFAVLTTDPNEVVADLHDRMAVLLAPGDRHRWLTGEDPRDLLEPHPPGEMHAYPVSERVNDPANDGPELVDPV